MSTPTLMNPNPDATLSSAATSSSDTTSPSTPDSLDPAQIRVVDVESEREGIVERFDCYEIGAEEKMFRLVGDEVQVRAVAWARSAAMDAEPEVRWVSTGLSFWEVSRIRVFTWPEGELVRIYRDVN